MGVLIDGVWRDEELPQETGRAGEFRRADSIFRDRITADGASGFKAEAGRYHLYVAHGCPWAHRTLIFRSLKALDNVISVSLTAPLYGKTGWEFGTARGGTPDKAPFRSAVADFYLTNPIARASVVMHECSALAKGAPALTAAE